MTHADCDGDRRPLTVDRVERRPDPAHQEREEHEQLAGHDPVPADLLAKGHVVET
jgi:hypothetical protein